MAGTKRPATAPADASDAPKAKRTYAKNGATKREAMEAVQAARAATPKTGRPREFTAEMKAEIIRRIEAGERMTAICRDAHLPDAATVYRARYSDVVFCAELARAKEVAALIMLDTMFDVAWDDRQDWEAVERRGATEHRVNREAVERSKIKIDLCKWTMARHYKAFFSDDATKITAETGDAASTIKQDATVIAPDEPGPDKPVL
jgi:hypothetical protein